MFKMMKKNRSVFQRLSDGFIEALAFLLEALCEEMDGDVA